MPELMPAERHAGGEAGGQPPWPEGRALSRPFGEFEELLDRLVNRSRQVSAGADTAEPGTPAADLAETPDGWVVQIQFPPGIDAGQVETGFAGRVLTVRVPRPASSPGGRKLN